MPPLRVGALFPLPPLPRLASEHGVLWICVAAGPMDSLASGPGRAHPCRSERPWRGSCCRLGAANCPGCTAGIVCLTGHASGASGVSLIRTYCITCILPYPAVSCHMASEWSPDVPKVACQKLFCVTLFKTGCWIYCHHYFTPLLKLP